MRKWVLMTSVALLAVTPTGLWAQESVDLRAGHAVARQICAACHAVEKGDLRSPNAMAPAFGAIAATPGMTAAALQAALHTSHRERTMPNLVLPPDDLRGIVAYILSLQP